MFFSAPCLAGRVSFYACRGALQLVLVRRFIVATLLAACFLALPLAAQTGYFSGVVTTLGTGYAHPSGVAIDKSGNVFFADTFHSQVMEFVAAGGYATVRTVGSGFIFPHGVAVDSAGNVFVADTDNSQVKEILAAGGYSTINVLGGTAFYSPLSVAVDAGGNVFVGDDNGIEEILAAGGYATIRTLSTTMRGAEGLAVDGNGNLFIADDADRAVKEMLAVNGSIPNNPTIVTLGSGFSQPAGIAVDGSGNVFVSDLDRAVLSEMVAVGGSVPANPTIKNLGDAYSYGPYGVAVDGNGNVFFADFLNAAVRKIAPSGGAFGSANVGSASPTILTFTFTFDTTGALGSTAVVTKGAAGRDFSDAGTGTCVAGGYYFGTNSCTLNVAFTPTAPGPRYGAVELFDNDGNLMATGYAQGSGVGPQINFSKITSGVYLPGAEVNLGAGFNAPFGVAVDDSGNIFVADTLNSAVEEIVAAGGYSTINLLGSGFSYPTGVALDGAGNVFVADSGNDAVKEIVAAGGYTTVNTLGSGFSSPEGVAIDGAGNVFVADYWNDAVKEIKAADGYSAVHTLGSGFSAPAGTAVDGSGNVFVADFGHNAVKEIVASSGYSTVRTVGGGFDGPFGLAVDATGNVFVADTYNGAVKKITAAGGYVAVHALGSGFIYPAGVALDNSGNVFVADQAGDAVVKLDYADSPALNFAGTKVGVQSSDSPRTVTVANSGNAALTFSSVTYPTDFFQGTDSNPCTASKVLNAGMVCDLPVGFLPHTSGPLSENLVLADNNLNANPAATQALHLTGTAFGAPLGALGLAVDSVTFSATVGQSNSLKVQGWIADPQDGAPLINVKVYVDGTSIGTPTLGIARTDIAAAYNNSAFLYSGYLMFYPASSLTLGTHKVTVVAVDSVGLSKTFGPHTITVAPTAGLGSPFGALGSAVDNVTASTTVSQSDSLKVQGWVADPQDGAPLGNVKVYVDGTSIGTPTLGIARPDIATAHNNNAYLYSGYRMLYPASSLSLGTHQVTVIAIDSGGRSTTLGPRSITVQ